MSNQNTLDTWDNRIEQAAKVMGLSPAKVAEILDNPEYKITSSDFRMEMLSDESVTPFGDLRKLFCDEAKVPVTLLRMAAKYLRGPVTSKKTDTIDPDLVDLQTKYGIKAHLEDLDVAQLLPYYKPNKVNNIHEILRKRYESKYGAFIAFKPDSTNVAIDETIAYIADLESNYSIETHIEVDGEPVPLCKIGEIPNQMVDEDPMYPNQPLKRNRSISNYLNWSNVGKDERTFFRILTSRNDIKPSDRVSVAFLIGKSIKELKDLFPEAYIEWKSKKQRDELPKLTMTLGEVASSKTNNPFSIRYGNRTT